MSARPRYQCFVPKPEGGHEHRIPPIFTKNQQNTENENANQGTKATWAPQSPANARIFEEVDFFTEWRDVKPSELNQTLVQKYGHVKEFLGAGSSGEVRLAHKEDTKELFAVKRYRTRKPLYYALHRYNPGQHQYPPNALPVAVQQALLNKFETMAWAEDNPEKSSLVQQEADCFFAQMMHGLNYLHGMGVAQCDMGLGNLLLTERGCVKICDFGLSKQCQRVRIMENLQTVPAVAQLMPPQMLHRKQESFRLESVDVWAAGVLHVLMRTGDYLWKRPREDDVDYARYLEERRKNACDKLNVFGKDCASVLYRMLDPDADARLTAIGVLVSAWFRSIHVCAAGMGL
ncbi:kinase-like domain-containing protein [Cadophora sp. MPI-SDFR-AT-0126]|nr:kinase-like domain-containing protein [Leotiomycetes sp. MPI-SDFR-AT-0126]